MKELIDEKTFVTGLTAAAIILFVAGAVLLAVARQRKRPALSFAGLAMLVGGPALWLFWLVYCGVVKHFGLDSVKGLGVNLVIFITGGALLGIFFGFLQRRKTGNL